MRKYTIGIIAISFILVLIFGTFFQAAPSVTEVLNALEKVDEFEYHAYIKEFEKSGNSTTILHGGVSLKKMEAYMEQVSIYEAGKSISQYAIYDDIYYFYELVISNGKVIINDTERTSLRHYTQNKRQFLKNATPFNWVRILIREFLINGTMVSIEKHEKTYVFVVEYQREEKSDYDLYKLNLNASIFVRDNLPVKLLINGTHTSIYLPTNEIRTIFATYEVNITYSYTSPEWLRELKGESVPLDTQKKPQNRKN